MERFLGRFEPHRYALLRIIAGLLFLMHGTQKILGWPGGGPEGELPARIVAAGWIEIVAGTLITIGLFGSLAAFIASGEMAFAYFLGHAKDGFWPILNKGELPVLYCFLFLYIAAEGSGIWSIDAARKRTRPTL
jgi:putative oxidoreductase